MRFCTGFVFFVFSLQEILAPDPVGVTKCCPDGQIYNSAEKRCVQGAGNLLIHLVSIVKLPLNSHLHVHTNSIVKPKSKVPKSRAKRLGLTQ